MATPTRGAASRAYNPGAEGLTPEQTYNQFLAENLHVTYADSPGGVRKCVDELERLAPSAFSLDFETSSKDGRWGPANGSLSLMQIGVQEPGIAPRQFLIDCHRVDPSRLNSWLADPDVETFVHYSDFELLWARTQLGVSIRGLYDTCIAWQVIQKKLKALDPAEAQQLLPGWEKHNAKLATLTDRYMGLPLPKDGQTSDWSRRPLSAQQLVYAAADAAVLPPLAHVTKRLAAQVGVSADVASRIQWVRGKVLDRAAQNELAVRDDRERVIAAMARAASVAELDRIQVAARQMALTPEASKPLAAAYRSRKTELLLSKRPA